MQIDTILYLIRTISSIRCRILLLSTIPMRQRLELQPQPRQRLRVEPLLLTTI